MPEKIGGWSEIMDKQLIVLEELHIVGLI